MQFHKKAFTMIELILVIVILGVLAAVALPKLSATRDDAYTAKLASNIMTGASEIASYAMANEQIDSNITLMSNAIANLSSVGDATVIPNKAVIHCGNINDCIELSIDSNTTTGVDTLITTFGNAGTDTRCASLQSAINANLYPMKLRGSNAKF